MTKKKPIFSYDRYEAYTHHPGQPIIGKATSQGGGKIDVFLWIIPTDGVFSLRQAKEE
jgi:hypothetical protein